MNLPRIPLIFLLVGLLLGVLQGVQATDEILSIEQVSELRVRDIKRRLIRNHGYSADEVGRILDKKELIQKLAFEEEKIRLKQSAEFQRTTTINALIVVGLTVAVIFCWPLIQHIYEVASVNLLVYYDRKKHEASRCYELQTYKGILGVVLMGIIDILQIWLTASVILSWVMTSKYFFPVPRLSVRPAALMGGEMAQSKAASYGINVGSMVITWAMRFCYSKIESLTGKAMAEAVKRQRKEARKNETPEERAARKAAKKAKQQEQQQTPTSTAPQPQLPIDWMQPKATDAPVPTNSHQAFMDEMEELPTCELDEMD